jgi:hypothetical protein
MIGVGFDGGEVIAVGSYAFEIDYDVAFSNAPPSDPVVYRLRGTGFGVGAPVGATFNDRESPWNRFDAPMVTTTRGFEGNAGVGGFTIQFGRIGSSETHVTLRPRAANGQEIRLNDFQTSGSAVAAAGGSVQGPFEIQP